MTMQEKVASLFQEIVQLPEDAQAEIVEEIVAMRYADLGILPADDTEPLHVGD